MNRTKVLIIDDDAFVRQLYRQVLQQAGYQILEADNGETGYLLALKEHPALILLDLHLPKLDGRGLLTRLRQDATMNDIYVLILSVRGEKGEVEHVLQMGADGYAVKGYKKPRDILEKIKELLGKVRVCQ